MFPKLESISFASLLTTSLTIKIGTTIMKRYSYLPKGRNWYPKNILISSRSSRLQRHLRCSNCWLERMDRYKKEDFMTLFNASKQKVQKEKNWRLRIIELPYKLINQYNTLTLIICRISIILRVILFRLSKYSLHIKLLKLHFIDIFYFQSYWVW